METRKAPKWLDVIFTLIIFIKQNFSKMFRYTIKNSKGMSLSVLTLGAMMRELWVPDKDGQFKDILLDYKDLSGMVLLRLDESSWFRTS